MNGGSLRIGSLFSGIEGFGVGFELAGATVEWTCEIDAYASRVLRVRYPGVPNHGDITTTNPESLGDVDCITFGFPCQDLSVVGHRAGLSGDRSGLFWEALVIVAAKKPRWIVAENVPGLLSSNEGLDFGVVLYALAALGYGVAYAELDAQHHGVPQRRRRIFLVGCLGDESRARKVLAHAHGGYRDSPPGKRTGSGTPRGFEGGVAHPLRSGRSISDVEGDPRNIVLQPARPLYYSHDYSQDRIYDGDGGARPAVTVGKREVFGTLRSNPRNNSNPASTPIIWDALTARQGKGPDSDGRGIGDDASPIAFNANQDPISRRDGTGAIGARAREGVGIPYARRNRASPTHLQPEVRVGADADLGGRPRGDAVGQPESPHHGRNRDSALVGDEEVLGRPASGRGDTAAWTESSPAPVDADRDGAPSGLPRWLDLPMWRGATEPWRLHVDALTNRVNRREEGRQGKRDAKRRTVDGGGGAVAGRLARERERAPPGRLRRAPEQPGGEPV